MHSDLCICLFRFFNDSRTVILSFCLTYLAAFTLEYSILIYLRLMAPNQVLVTGSLHLVGDVLRLIKK